MASKIGLYAILGLGVVGVAVLAKESVAEQKKKDCVTEIADGIAFVIDQPSFSTKLYQIVPLSIPISSAFDAAGLKDTAACLRKREAGEGNRLCGSVAALEVKRMLQNGFPEQLKSFVPVIHGLFKTFGQQRAAECLEQATGYAPGT